MNGIIVINKQKACTSHDVVYKVKKILNEKCGHTGTLDPNATGVLPILVGKGTLLSKYLINHDKTYEVVLKLGQKTDTLDSEGAVIKEKEVDINCLKEKNVEKVLKNFIGKQEQIPPIYSAIKVKGKKLYEYARKGQKVTIEPRKIEIYNIQLMNINIEKQEVLFSVSCSKGTYIRSLCEDIAEKLNTVGHMKELNRTQAGQFKIQEAINIEVLEKKYSDKKFMDEHFISIEKLFKNNSNIILHEKKLQNFLNGVKLQYDFPDGIYKIYSEKDIFIGTGIVKDKILKRDIVI